MPKSILAGMIFRDHRMIIPHGDDCFQPHDNAYFIGIPEEIEKFSQNFVQRDARKLHRVMIIGAGRAGRYLAPMLEKQGVYRVQTKKSFPLSFPNTTMPQGRLTPSATMHILIIPDTGTSKYCKSFSFSYEHFIFCP